MYFVSKFYGNDLYEVTDTKDGIKEIYELAQLLEIVKTIPIYGVSQEGISISPYDEMSKDFLVREKLLGRQYYNPFYIVRNTYNTPISCIARYSKTVPLPEVIKVPDFCTSLDSSTFAGLNSCKSVRKLKLGTLTVTLCERSLGWALNISDIDLRNASWLKFGALTKANLKELRIPNTMQRVAMGAFAYGFIKRLDFSQADFSRLTLDRGAFIDLMGVREIKLPRGIELDFDNLMLKNYKDVKITYV